MKVCPSCGRENADNARFCSACGTRLEPEAASREERKVVTCLFCDLVGFTARAESLDPEDVRRVLQPYHARLRSELERFGGTVEKFIGDAVMAVFGAPVAHEDDPERAVRAALAIRDALAEEGELEIRIGITTGEALIALDARPETGEGMASGDVVNTAARLQTAASPGSILVDGTTYHATDRAIEYGETPPIEAKGKSMPIAAWEALRARARVGVERVGGAKLVGRERELTLLRETFGRVARECRPQLVTLVGVPGIGKSRLVFELFQTIERGDFGIVFWRRGGSLPYGDGVTFWALSEMVKAQAGILESDSAEQAGTRLREAVERYITEPADASWVERHLRPLAGLDAEEPSAGDRRGEAFAAWRRFSRRSPKSGPSCSSSRICTGRTMPCSTSSTILSSGRAVCRFWLSARPGRNCCHAGRNGEVARSTRRRSCSRRSPRRRRQPSSMPCSAAQPSTPTYMHGSSSMQEATHFMRRSSRGC